MHLDATQPIHDELKLQPLWWLLEIIPLTYSWQDEEGKLMGIGDVIGLRGLKYADGGDGKIIDVFDLNSLESSNETQADRRAGPHRQRRGVTAVRRCRNSRGMPRASSGRPAGAARRFQVI